MECQQHLGSTVCNERQKYDLTVNFIQLFCTISNFAAVLKFVVNFRVKVHFGIHKPVGKQKL